MIEEYDFEIPRIIAEIKKHKAKRILLQFPDGLKPYAAQIADEIKKRLKIEILIWFDTCFGACDLPLETEKIGVDLIIQFGHANWDYKRKDIKVLR